MFKDSMGGVSNLSFSLFASVKDMITKNNMETVVDSEVQFINEEGDVYIPYSKEYGVFKSRDREFPAFYPGGSKSEPFNRPVYFQDFKSEFIEPNITTVGYNKSISMPSMLKQLAEQPEVYGAVIQVPDKRNYSINPLHPMISFLIMSGLMELPEEGKLHIFEYRDSKMSDIKNKTKSRHIKSYIKDYEKFFAMAPDIVREPLIVKQSAMINDREITSLINDPFIENIGAHIDIIKQDVGGADLNKIKSLLIPEQLIMDGTVSPYYGISSITSPVNSDIRGHGLGPMVTGNISLYHDGGERNYEEFLSSGDSQNVCTGSETSTLPKGWFTLSKVNLNSMYFSDVIDKKNVFSFIEASKQISAEIWEAYIDAEAAALEDGIKSKEEETTEV